MSTSPTPGADDPALVSVDDDPEREGSDAWWRNRSNAELRQIVGLGLTFGDTFDRAARELEQRLREEEERAREDEEAIARTERKRRRTLDAVNIAAIIALLLLIVAAAVILRM